MLQKFGRARNYFCIEKYEADGDVGIDVVNGAENVKGLDNDVKFLFAFTDEGVLTGFATLNLSANKLPQEPSCLMLGALTNHKFVPSPHKPCHDFNHFVLSYVRIGICARANIVMIYYPTNRAKSTKTNFHNKRI